LYTAFDLAATQGIPIMRPMFVDFPQEAQNFSIATQFMWGDNILVSPKLQSPVSNYYNYEASAEIWAVATVLPKSASWYNLITNKLETESRIAKTYTDDQIPSWVKAGSVIPILNH